MISRFQKTTTNLMVLLSVAAAPVSGVADNRCCPQPCAPVCAPCEQPCEDYGCQTGCGSNWQCWVGGALLGAAAGAIAGAAVSNGKHGHHRRGGECGADGACGPCGAVGATGATGLAGATGATGASPFVTDAGTITFGGTLALTAGVTLLGPAPTGIFFVTLPNGVIYQGALTPNVVGPLLLGFTVPDIAVPAVFGEYAVGVEITVPDALLGIGVSLPLILTATPTTTAPVTSVFEVLPAITLVLGTAGTSQVSANYTYYPSSGLPSLPIP